LYYCDNKWKLTGEKTATANTKELMFEYVPYNALYLLIPEYQPERSPFMIMEDGKRFWW